MAVSKVTLSNGVEMPQVAAGCAFGNWTGDSDFQGFLPEQAWLATQLALENGVTHFDTARAYGTERHLGNVLGQAMMQGKITRNDVFITTKLAHPRAPPHVNISHKRTWDPRDFEGDIRMKILDDFDKSLEDLGIGQADLLLVHWPGTFGETDKEFAREMRKRVWRAFCEIYKKNGARAIGVCNFTKGHLEQLSEDLSSEDDFVFPMVNQVEFNPYCNDKELLAFCQEKKIIVEAYAPLASGSLGLVKDEKIAEIGKKYGKSIGQTILRWIVQQGIVVLPKSSKAHRIRENMDIFDFELSEEDMAAITDLGKEGPRRTCPDPGTIV